MHYHAAVKVIKCIQFRIQCSCLIACIVILLGATKVSAEEQLRQFDIPSQSLDGALLAFSIQADLDVVGMTTALRPIVVRSLQGIYTRTAALDLLLADTGLEYRFSGPHQIAIYVPEVAEPEIIEQPESARFIEEIIVLATRRPTNLQDTPVSVTAFNQAQLDRNQVKDLRGISNVVPGLEMINSGSQSAVLVQLRGVGTTNITEIADGPVAIHVDGIRTDAEFLVASIDIDNGVPVMRSLLARGGTYAEAIYARHHAFSLTKDELFHFESEDFELPPMRKARSALFALD